MCVSSAELEDSIQRLLPGRQATEGSMPFAALLACPYALSSSAQLEVLTQRSDSSSRTSMSPKKHKPCRAEEPHGIRENRSSMHFPPSKPPEVRQGFQWSVKPRTRTRPVGHWRAGLAESGIRENASNTTATLNVTSPDSPFTSVRSTSHDRMIGRRLLDCGMRHRQSRAPRGIFGRQKQ